MNFPAPDSPKNYPNGGYIGTCLICNDRFFGPKRSRICAECTSREVGDGDNTQATEAEKL